MEGGQGDALLQSGHYGVVDEHGAGELLAAMDHAVSDGVDLGHALDHAVLGAGESVEDGLNGLRVGGHGDVELVLAVGGGHLVGQAAVDADALTETLGQDLFGLRDHELIFEGRTASVDDEDFHNRIPLLKKVWFRLDRRRVFR